MRHDGRIAGSTAQRLLARSCESLIGIANGLIADGELNDRELQFLSTWLSENAIVASAWPGEVVYKRVREALADGVVTEEERSHLVETLQQLVGGAFSEDGAVPCGANALPIDNDVLVLIPQQTFCFTGKFLFGTQAACERAIASRGGAVLGVQHDLSYLVIGELSSREWKYSSHGTKIEAAIHLRSKGRGPWIVSEEQWVSAL